MSAFVDETSFDIRSGDGGAGSSHFRREKYVPRGGPDGGDGGKGGDVVFVTRRNLATLAHLRGKPVQKAQNGEPGRGRKKHGRNGEDLVIPVPPGTRISDAVTGNMLHDFPENIEGETWVCLQGGKGGLGNWHFRTSRNQAPVYSQDGLPGVERKLSIELSLIADIGLVGLPSAGKSSLVNALTAANSKVGAYPFTTKVPHLGVLRRGDSEVVIADIPGLIEGASHGAGLGYQFLKHISRAASLCYLTDLGEADPTKAVHLLEDELRAYDPQLVENKERMIVGTKLDLRSDFAGETVIGVSVFTREGLEKIINAFIERGSAVR